MLKWIPTALDIFKQLEAFDPDSGKIQATSFEVTVNSGETVTAKCSCCTQSTDCHFKRI